MTHVSRVAAFFVRSVILTSLALAGCEGFMLDGPAGPRSDAAAPVDRDAGGLPDAGAGTEHPACADDVCLGAGGLVHLTQAQYITAAADLVGRALDPTLPDQLPADRSLAIEAASGAVFRANDFDLETPDVESYLLVAESLTAGNATSGLTRDELDSITGGCTVPACAADAIASIGRRLFRRSLSSEEIAEYHALSEIAPDAPAGAVRRGMRTVLTTMLMSPHFLYRVEIGAPVSDGVYRLTGLEIATRLSLFLWSSNPDEDLLRAAESGELDTADGVASRARSMILDPRFERTLALFHRQWLNTEALPRLGFTAE
jgi:hypothetical protein